MVDLNVSLERLNTPNGGTIRLLQAGPYASTRWFDSEAPPVNKTAIPCGGHDCPFCKAGLPQSLRVSRYGVIGIEQFRKPRSKKKRIRKKWCKNPNNWRPRPGGYAEFSFRTDSALAKFMAAIAVTGRNSPPGIPIH